MSDLTEFLLARIAAREADVRARKTYAVGHTSRCIFEGGYEGTGSCDCGAAARVLAECEAKRQIVELHGDGIRYCFTCRTPRAGEPVAFPCETIRAVALPYADHPDYREEWKP